MFNRRSKFIVFEGIDGAGTQTQSKLLADYLKKQKKPLERLTYPDKRGLIGKLIYEYLDKKHNLTTELQFLLHLADFAKDQEIIKKRLDRGKIVIADRYFTSTLAYQGAKGFPLKKALLLAKTMEIIKPDLIIFLKVSPAVSMARKYKEKKKLDRHEGDKKLLGQVAKFYEKLIKNQVFATWQVIDGEKPVSDVFEAIKKAVKI